MLVKRSITVYHLFQVNFLLLAVAMKKNFGLFMKKYFHVNSPENLFIQKIRFNLAIEKKCVSLMPSDFFWFYEWSTKKYWDQKCLDWMWWITDHFISYLNIVNLSYASKTRILSYQNNDSFSYCYSYRLFHFIILFCQ